jgi:hypothetical protein
MLLLQRSGQWLHVLNVARFVHAAEHGRQANVCYAVYEEGSGAADTVDLLCSGDIAAGEEVVACCRPGGCGEMSGSDDRIPAVLPLCCYRRRERQDCK